MKSLVILLFSFSFAYATSNSEILEFIGSPVVYTHPDKAYSEKELKSAFKKACKKINVKIVSVEVDTTEFPPLLYGQTEPRKSNQSMQAIVEKMGSKYSYSGAVSGPQFFCLNAVPFQETPPELFQKVANRSVRKSVLHNKAKHLTRG